MFPTKHYIVSGWSIRQHEFDSVPDNLLIKRPFLQIFIKLSVDIEYPH